ncbi:hypothetical protein E4U55_007437, partial [Claviceps digitariae]
DLTEIEDWNEYGELKQHVKIYYDEYTIPNIHNKPPEPKKAKKPAAKPAVATNTPVASKKAAPTASAAPAPPPAPPLPEPKPSSASTTTAKTADKDKPSTEEKQTTLPLRSVADEAAQKAKELRLKSLREKVHGKGTDGEASATANANASGGAGAGTSAEPSRKTKSTTLKIDPPRPREEAPGGESKSKSAALKSPTSPSWENDSGLDFIPETVQSPRSGKWRPGSLASAISDAQAADVPPMPDAAKAEKLTAEKTNVPGKDAGGKDGEQNKTEGLSQSEGDRSNEDGNKDTKAGASKGDSNDGTVRGDSTGDSKTVDGTKETAQENNTGDAKTVDGKDETMPDNTADTKTE